MEDQDIALAVENYLMSSKAIDAASHEKSEKKYYLSDMGKCHRMRWLKRKGISSEFDKHVNWIFQIGQMYHDYIYKALEAQGMLLEAEEVILTDHFSGRFDGIVKDKEGKSVLDIKSIVGYGLEQIIKGGEKEENIAQVLSYLMLMRDQGRKDLTKAVLLYVNKEPNDKNPTMFLQRSFYLTKPREEKVRAEMDKMIGYWVNDVVPPCTCPAWMKNYNAYEPLCSAPEKKIREVLKLAQTRNIITTKKGLYSMLPDGTDRKDLHI